MKTEALATVLLFVISVSLTGSTNAPAVSAATTYPFKTIFERDLSSIVRSTHHIQAINVIQTIDFIHAVVIRISYTAHLSDLRKIALQNAIRSQLQTKWYIFAVDPNSILCIPEATGCPPWPGFVIGELIVGFISMGIPSPEWPTGSTLTASNVQATSLNLTWTHPNEKTGLIGYRIYQDGKVVAIVYESTWNYLVTGPGQGTTYSYDVTGLRPGTRYTFQIEAGNTGGWKLGPGTTIITHDFPLKNHQPPCSLDTLHGHQKHFDYHEILTCSEQREKELMTRRDALSTPVNLRRLPWVIEMGL